MNNLLVDDIHACLQRVHSLYNAFQLLLLEVSLSSRPCIFYKGNNIFNLPRPPMQIPHLRGLLEECYVIFFLTKQLLTMIIFKNQPQNRPTAFQNHHKCINNVEFIRYPSLYIYITQFFIGFSNAQWSDRLCLMQKIH